MDRLVVSILTLIGLGPPPPGFPGGGIFVIPPCGQLPPGSNGSLPIIPPCGQLPPGSNGSLPIIPPCGQLPSGCNGSLPIVPPWLPGCNGTIPFPPPWIPRPPCQPPYPTLPPCNATTDSTTHPTPTTPALSNSTLTPTTGPSDISTTEVTPGSSTTESSSSEKTTNPDSSTPEDGTSSSTAEPGENETTTGADSTTTSVTGDKETSTPGDSSPTTEGDITTSDSSDGTTAGDNETSTEGDSTISTDSTTDSSSTDTTTEGSGDTETTTPEDESSTSTPTTSTTTESTSTTATTTTTSTTTEPSTTTTTTTTTSTTTEPSTTTEYIGNSGSLPFDNPHFVSDRSGIVHLHEWKFLDIAKECEDYLGPNGFAAVQTSPANENLIIKGRPWYERYQPLSYEIRTRSGDAKDFLEMARRCRKVGVIIYVDVVTNQMTSNAPVPAMGTAGSVAYPAAFFYPGVPYNASHFHQPACQITNVNDTVEARVCELDGLHDLDQSNIHVQLTIANFLNYLMAIGAAGFRIDSAKFMYPEDLKKIYSRLNPLSVMFGFPADSFPYVYQHVNDSWKFNYTQLGAVTEFSHARNMAAFFNNELKPSSLENYGGTQMGMLPDKSAVTFLDDQDLQRTNVNTLTNKSPRELRAAYVFTFAHPYGIPRVMSSFEFKTIENGPPQDRNENIVSPKFDSSGQCKKGWVCEHRWPVIRKMVEFSNVVGDLSLTNFKSDDTKGIVSFCRGNKGFVLISSGIKDFNEKVYTCLPQGTYCNAVTDKSSSTESCDKSSRIVVKSDGTATIKLTKKGTELAVALHVGNVMRSLETTTTTTARTTRTTAKTTTTTKSSSLLDKLWDLIG